MTYCDFGPGTGFTIPRLLRHIHFHVSVWGVQPSCFFTLLSLCHVLERREWHCVILKGKSSHSCWDFHITLVPGLLSNERMPVSIACSIPLRKKKTNLKQSNMYQTQHLFFKQMIKKTPLLQNKGENIFQTPHNLHITLELILSKFQDLVKTDSS